VPRFACHFVAAAAAVWIISGYWWLSLPGGLTAYLGIAGVVLTLFWIVGLTNVYNFMDGIDGIAGVQGVVAGLAWVMAGLMLKRPEVAVLGALLTGACAGFLRHNWSPARIFMGDVGSAFLGYAFAVLPLLALRGLSDSSPPHLKAAMPVFALLVVWPFVGDGFFTFLRRARQGEPVWKPHRSHLYQRLVQSGWPHARVSTLYALWSLVSAALGLLWLNGICNANTVAAFALISLTGMIVLVTRFEQQAARRHG
jgi:UDP-N-acetylmuramyl pentapeptide phosphotransferase/UDP-N-acetylglucosamine-1-phosphate transferase